MRHDVDQPSAAEDLRRWLGEAAVPPPTGEVSHDGTVARRSRRRMAVAAAIAVPWVVVLVAVLSDGAPPSRGAALPAHRTTSRAGLASEPAGSATERAESTTDPVAEPTEPATEAVDPAEPADPADGNDHGAPAAAGPVAVGAVRDAVTSTGDTTSSALDVAAAEPARRLADATWIVRVHAVVLSGDGRHWRSANHETWVVPVGSRRGTVVALDRPWRVAHGAPPSTQVRWEPTDVDIDDVRVALRRAGLPAPSDIAVERHPVLTGVLRATAHSRDGTSRVWLRSTPRLAVLGDRAAGVRP